MSPERLEGIRFKAAGSMYSIEDVAVVSARGAKLMIVTVYEPDLLQDVIDAIG